VHQGEEPPLCGKKGICNVFFAHCNLQCIYCQNGDISTLSDPTSALIRYRGVDAIVEGIAQTLKQTENIVGFVTPTHYANHIPAIVEGLHQRGLSPVTVYNTGGYESINTLQMLAPYIDIYLPDFKYMDPQLALRYSHAQDYPTVALKALKEMYNQKGSALPTDDDGLAYRGIIVRHLVLPGQVENSLAVLDEIADLSPNLHVALMAQYFPPAEGLPDQLGRTLTAEEYVFHTFDGDYVHGAGVVHGYQITGVENFLLTRSEIIFMSGAVHLQENETFSAELFHDETFASEEHGSDLLLEEDGDIYTLSRRKEGALLRDDRAIRSDFNAADASGETG
jgi:putative pyruvate formate lyase activating enzyme